MAMNDALDGHQAYPDAFEFVSPIRRPVSRVPSDKTDREDEEWQLSITELVLLDRERDGSRDRHRSDCKSVTQERHWTRWNSLSQYAMCGYPDRWWEDVLGDRIKRRIVTVPARYVPPRPPSIGHRPMHLSSSTFVARIGDRSWLNKTPDGTMTIERACLILSDLEEDALSAAKTRTPRHWDARVSMMPWK
jgi:hypothetical protein